MRKQLDLDTHREKPLDPGSQKMNADSQPCLSPWNMFLKSAYLGQAPRGLEHLSCGVFPFLIIRLTCSTGRLLAAGGLPSFPLPCKEHTFLYLLRIRIHLPNPELTHYRKLSSRSSVRELEPEPVKAKLICGARALISYSGSGSRALDPALS